MKRFTLYARVERYRKPDEFPVRYCEHEGCKARVAYQDIPWSDLCEEHQLQRNRFLAKMRKRRQRERERLAEARDLRQQYERLEQVTPDYAQHLAIKLLRGDRIE